MTRDRAAILVVEDDQALRRSLDITLSRADYEVRAEQDGQGLAEALRDFDPDLAILDVRLPEGPDGFAIARRLRRETDLPILFLTAADGPEDRLEGFQAGGDHYLVKPYDVDELLASVKALLRRTGREKYPVWRVGDVVVETATRTAMRGDAKLDLTRTEYELLAVLVQEAGTVLSKDQLLSRVWGFDAYDTNLVEVHLSSLRRKMEARGPRIVHTLRGAGYVLRP